MIVNRGPDPGPFSKHGLYKAYLRPLFQNRCAYCLTPDDSTGGLEGMTVDHFQPESRFPQLRLRWSNLYYACFTCNSHYKKQHPTEDEQLKGHRFVDACAEDPDDHFRMIRDGKTRLLCKVKALTAAARFTLRILKLNDRRFLRETWMQLERLERDAVRRLQDVNRCVKDARALIHRGLTSDEIQRLLDSALAERRRILARLQEVRARRPFPVEGTAIA
jgi:uncharacterized protein (TIGR02646 family)